MSKTVYHIYVESLSELNTYQKDEMLADIREALQQVSNKHSDKKLIVSREFTNEELLDSLRTPKTDSQSREQCIYYDEAQGRHHCCHPMVKSNRCNGVCKDYRPKRT